MMHLVQVSGLLQCAIKVFCYCQAEDAERREKNLEEAKKVIIENDPSLPEPKTVSQRTLGPPQALLVSAHVGCPW